MRITQMTYRIERDTERLPFALVLTCKAGHCQKFRFGNRNTLQTQLELKLRQPCWQCETARELVKIQRQLKAVI